jgi:hypothetical protein
VWYLAGLFTLFGHSVFIPGILASSLGLLVVGLTYILAQKWWSRKAAAIASLILATSPLAVTQARMSFMTNPIPLFGLIFFITLVRGVKKPRDGFWLVLSFALLFQFELASFPLLLLIALVYFKRFTTVKNKWPDIRWVSAGLLFGLAPQLVYDLTHRFQQTGLFLGWVGYRLVRFTGIIPHKASGISQTPEALKLIVTYMEKIASWDQMLILVFEFGVLVMGAILLIRKRKFTEITPIALNYFWLIIMIASYVVHGAPSEAYFPVLFVPWAMVLGWAVGQFTHGWKTLFTFAILTIALFNSYTLWNSDYMVYSIKNLATAKQLPYGSPVLLQQEVIDTLVRLTNHQPLKLRAIGPGSEFPSYLDAYRFLLLAQGITESETGVPVTFVFGGAEKTMSLINQKIYSLYGISFTLPISHADSK